MHSLLRFLIRHNYAFLFLFLQGLAFTFYIQSHYYQRAHFINSANALTGNVYKSVSNVEEYFLLKQENERLQRENEVLRELNKFSTLKMMDEHMIIDDTLYEQQYTYFPAKVINSSIYKKNNYITINKGRLNGVSEDMAVIGPEGVVGSTKDVSDHFATVIPVINTNFRLDVSVQRNNQVGTVSWRNDEGLDHLHAQIKDVPITADVLVGDTIVTSGHSRKYPKAVPVGVVTEVEKRESESKLFIVLKLFTDFGEVNGVHVVQNLLRDEWTELEEESEKDL